MEFRVCHMPLGICQGLFSGRALAKAFLCRPVEVSISFPFSVSFPVVYLSSFAAKNHFLGRLLLCVLRKLLIFKN